ncbi:hypothetical protein V6O07_12555, partial [Arthrospira platensis SPKY2]
SMSRYSATTHSRQTVLSLEADELTLAVASVAAAGANQGNATALPAVAIVTVTAADAAKGVRLPPAVPGRVIILKNVDNAVLKVYPATGGKINVLADNASLDMAARTATVLFAVSATQWYSLPLLPS